MPQYVYETLPCKGWVDLDHSRVETLASVIEETEAGYGDVISAVTSSGKIGLLHNATGETQWVYWGKTDKTHHGLYNVVVDVPAITLDILRLLNIIGVVEGDYPAQPIPMVLA